MYQAVQNALLGFGSICGVSFGGALADTIGWRWCFLLQVPIWFVALVSGYLVIKNPKEVRSSLRILWQRISFSGALVLVFALCLQLLGLSLGGNELPWSNIWVILSRVGSGALLTIYVVVEGRTSTAAVDPLRMLRGGKLLFLVDPR
jgi:MFS family permease